LAARTQPLRDSTTVTGSLTTSSVSSIACAAARATSWLRRSSPILLGVRDDLLAHQLLAAAPCCLSSFSSRRARPQAPPARRGSSFPRAREVTQLGLEDRLGLRFAKLEARISSGFGSSSVRTMRITSSRFRYAINRPSRIAAVR
jgi:hypothetical protein